MATGNQQEPEKSQTIDKEMSKAQSEEPEVESSGADTSPNGVEAFIGHEQSQHIERAEQILGNLGVRAGHQLTQLSREILRASARAREEAEDIWAEARNIRRG